MDKLRPEGREGARMWKLGLGRGDRTDTPGIDTDMGERPSGASKLDVALEYIEWLKHNQQAGSKSYGEELEFILSKMLSHRNIQF